VSRVVPGVQCGAGPESPRVHAEVPGDGVGRKRITLLQRSQSSSWIRQSASPARKPRPASIAQHSRTTLCAPTAHRQRQPTSAICALPVRVPRSPLHVVAARTRSTEHSGWTKPSRQATIDIKRRAHSTQMSMRSDRRQTAMICCLYPPTARLASREPPPERMPWDPFGRVNGRSVWLVNPQNLGKAIRFHAGTLSNTKSDTWATVLPLAVG
jgi:hypothetical protein